jgi:hypothetical protein
MPKENPVYSAFMSIIKIRTSSIMLISMGIRRLRRIIYYWKSLRISTILYLKSISEGLSKVGVRTVKKWATN